MSEETREALAAYAHEAWSGWMRYMFGKSGIVRLEHMAHVRNGDVIITSDLAERWMRQMNTPYADLPESEKASDRDEADRILAIINGGNHA